MQLWCILISDLLLELTWFYSLGSLTLSENQWSHVISVNDMNKLELKSVNLHVSNGTKPSMLEILLMLAFTIV